MANIPELLKNILGEEHSQKLYLHLSNTIQLEKSGKAYFNRYYF